MYVTISMTTAMWLLRPYQKQCTRANGLSAYVYKRHEYLINMCESLTILIALFAKTLTLFNKTVLV